MMKSAYLIAAHNSFEVLKVLLASLDDPRNDIFIHFDSKVRQLPELHTKYAGLLILSDRVDVRWGEYSQIQAYYSLYAEAYKHGPYEFYHLLSGTTLPMKSQDYIQEHFATLVGSSVFRMWPKDDGDADFKIRRIHFGIRNFQSRKSWLKWLVQHAWTANMFVQRKFGIWTNKNEILYKTDCWASLSESAIKYLLDNKQNILRRYKYSFTGDEYYLLSELKKDPSQKIVDDQHLLFVEFEFDHPRALTTEDYHRLIDSDYIFARKFDENVIAELRDMQS